VNGLWFCSLDQCLHKFFRLMWGFYLADYQSEDYTHLTEFGSDVKLLIFLLVMSKKH